MASPTATVTTNYYDLPAPLAAGGFYAWRVDVVSGSGTTTGGVRTFGIRFAEGPAVPRLGSSTSSAYAIALSENRMLVGAYQMAQLLDFDPLTGATAQQQPFTALNGGDGVLALDGDKAAFGSYYYDTSLTDVGAALVFRPVDGGYWESSGPLTLPTPVASELFGSSLAASGNLLLAGTGDSSSRIGRVGAFITEPTATRVQTFTAADATAGDNFGYRIAMEGNQAIIAAPGRGPGYTRLGCLYAFSRSTTTGQWAQTQKIAIPGATTAGGSGKALALCGDLLATVSDSGAVVIYTRNGSGQWIQSASIARASVAGSSTSFGANLALSGDLLFIGDAAGTYQGSSRGAVFVFRRSGTNWTALPAISPATNPALATHTGFGGALAARDGWLAVGGGIYQQVWMFHVDSAAKRTPQFLPGIPSQGVIGRALNAAIRAQDADGNDSLTIDLLQGPAWLYLTDNGDGNATLTGTPTGTSGDVSEVQLRVRDGGGAEVLYALRFTVLAAGDLPRLTAEPANVATTVGRELILTAVADGTGPFQWQWYHDGELLDGATQATLAFDEITLADAGRYQVRVTNTAGEDLSTEASVTVHAATRLDGGDWPTFGGSPAHSGRYAAALDSCNFAPAWSQAVVDGRALNRAVIAGDKAFVTAPTGSSGSLRATGVAAGLDLTTGAPLWSFPVVSSYSINPPTVFDGRVYFQRVNNSSGNQLFSLNAATGAQVWASSFGAQWDGYEAPAVSALGIFFNGGTYGGMYGFNFDGSSRFFLSLPQIDGWTPTIHRDRLFSFVGGSFIEHDPATSATLWSLPNQVGTAVIAAQGNSALVANTASLSCFDLRARSLRWKTLNTYSGRPAIGAGRAFTIQGNTVRSYGLADGTPGTVYQADEALIGQPVIFNDRLVISSDAKTWVFDLSEGRLLQSLGAGGTLSYANGYLLAAGNDGVLRAFLATPRPRIVVEHPPGTVLVDEFAVVDCGAPPPGVPAVTQFTLRNTGLADLAGIAATIDGAATGDFAVTTAPAASLAPAESATFRVTFTPTAAGPREAVLHLASNDPDHASFDITLVGIPPVLNTLAASGITGTSAFLNGSANARSHDATLAFEWGLDTTYGNTVDATPSSATGENTIDTSAQIGGLKPGTLYHFRLLATNAYGTHRGADMSFTTLSDNAQLARLTTSGGTLAPAFVKTLTHYYATVPFATSGATVTPTTDHPGATVQVEGSTVASGAASGVIPLAVGNTTLTIFVTAEDGIATMTYSVTVTRLPQEFVFNSAGDMPVTANGFSAGGYPATLVLGYAPLPGTILTMVNNTGLEFIYGKFSNLAHGQRVTLNYGGRTYDFVANYFGGSGNDLVLQWAETKVVAWGSNSYGQLGDATTTRRLLPTSVDDSGVLAGKTLLTVAGGYLHSLALCSDGTLAVWGYNVYGQLGNNSAAPSSVPVAVDQSGVLAGKTVIAISAGPFHNLALCADGTVAAWGYNNYGQLGTGDKTTSRVPVTVNPVAALAGKQVVAVAAAAYSSFALCADGTLAAWGYNDEGELGDGSTANSPVPVAVDTSGALAGKQIASLSAGQYHTLALCTDGTLVAWGYNNRGQLGNDSNVSSKVPVAIGSSGILSGKTVVATRASGAHSLALCADGTLAAWGWNHKGQLGVTGMTQSPLPLPIAMTGAAITQIAIGGSHGLVLGEDGTMAAWGDNAYGQLGNNSLTASSAPVAVDMSSLEAGSRVMFAASGSAALHNLAVVALPTARLTSGESWLVGSTLIDSDHDGIANLIEYAFGLSGANNTARLPQPQRAGDSLEMRFTEPAGVTGITYGAEWSATLQPGSWKDIPDTGSGTEHVFSVPEATAPNLFLRLKVTQP